MNCELSDLISEIHASTGISPATIRTVSRLLFSSIQSHLKAQETVLIPDFGKFTFKHRRATINKNLLGGPDTYSPENSKLTFIPERHWENWQRVHSSIIPDELPPNTRLGVHLSRSHRVRSEYPQHAADNTDQFFQQLIIPRAIRRKKQ